MNKDDEDGGTLGDIGDEDIGDLSELSDDEVEALAREARTLMGEVPGALPRFVQAWLQKPVLSREEEYVLARRMHAGDRAAYNELMGRNLRFVISLAWRLRKPGESFSDTFQDGVLGLHQAVMKFDVTRGLRLSTYATWWVRYACGRNQQRATNPVRLGITKVERMGSVYHVQARLEAQHGEAAPEAIAAATGLTVKQVEFLLRAIDDIKMVSLDRAVSNHDATSFVDHVADPDLEEAFALVGVPAKMEDARFLTLVADIDRASREMFFLKGLGWTLREIGNRFGYSRETVRQILRGVAAHIFTRLHCGASVSADKLQELRENLRVARTARVAERVVYKKYIRGERLRGRKVISVNLYKRAINNAHDPEDIKAFVRLLVVEPEHKHEEIVVQQPLEPARELSRLTLKAPMGLCVPILLPNRRIERLCVAVEERIAALTIEVAGLRSTPHDPQNFPAAARALGRVEGLLKAACAELAALRTIARQVA